VTNNGPSTVTAATVSDVLPSGTTFVSATNGATYNAGTNTVSYTSDTLASAGTASFTLTLAISPTLTGSLANTTTVAPPSGVTDTVPGNDSSTDTDTVLTPHLTITKTGDPAPVNSTDTVHFTITVSNTGTGTAFNVLLTDLLPDAS